MKLGAVMGGSVGLCIGFIFGGYNLVKHGAGPNGFLRSLGGYMAGSAATFGYALRPLPAPARARSHVYSFFMSIGTAIRTEEPSANSNAVMLDWARRRTHAAQILAAKST